MYLTLSWDEGRIRYLVSNGDVLNNDGLLNPDAGVHGRASRPRSASSNETYFGLPVALYGGVDAKIQFKVIITVSQQHDYGTDAAFLP